MLLRVKVTDGLFIRLYSYYRPQFRFVASPQIQEQFGDMFRNFYEWAELEKRQCFPAPSTLEAKEGQEGELYIPGGGIAKTLYEEL